MPIFRNEFHTGHKVTLIETDDISDKAITKDKLADDVRPWILQVFEDAVSAFKQTVQGWLDALSRRLSSAEGRITSLEERPVCTCKKFVVLTQEEYDALPYIVRGVPYFIIEPEENTMWRFGDPLPIILGGYGTAIGEPFPILLH